MTNLNFLINSAQFIISLFDLKQQLLTGTVNSNVIFSNQKNVEELPLERSSKEIRESEDFYQNPVLRGNSPDPGVVRLQDGSGWALVTTTNNATVKSSVFPMYFSKDLVNWKPRGFVLKSSNWPSWARGRMWAPELHYVNGRYITYFTAADKDDKLNIGAAVATTEDPFGEYEDIGGPLVENSLSLAGALDPHYFKDPVSGRDYLLWKEDSLLEPSLIQIRELRKDGISFLGRKRTILRQSLGGERLVTEAPWLMYRDGYYYLFYSSGWYFEAKYHMRVAKAKSPLGPYVKRKLPILENDWGKYSRGENTGFLGPGHGSVVDVEGQWWVVYHSWRYGRVNTSPGRQLLLDPVIWQSGWPVVGSPSFTRQPKPKVLT